MDRLPTPVLLGFPCGSADKKFTCNAGDLGLIPGLGRFPGEGTASPSSTLRAWRISYSPWSRKESTRLSDFHFHSKRSGSNLIPCPTLSCLDTRGDSLAGSRGNLAAGATLTACGYRLILTGDYESSIPTKPFRSS